MLSFQQISFARGNKVLFENASTVLFQKQKVGLVGKNGCGKSTLFSIIQGHLHVDTGEVQLHPNIQISVLQQELPHGEESILDYVLAGDEEYIHWKLQLESALLTNNSELVSKCHEQLEQMNAYSKPALAASILSGLGFSYEQQQLSVNSFSGGWRMRLSLARCLLKPADLYLLDEPTNHLDLEAIFWLEQWLKDLSATVLLISHDREFLDAVVDKILHVEHAQMKIYSGNYTNFENVRAQQLLQHQAQYESQQRHIQHMMSFVNRFKAKASKSKQAQSRLKAIERLELVAQAHVDSGFNFEFYPTEDAGVPLLKCVGLTVGYEYSNPIIQQVFFELNPKDRIALLGLNGQGKSSFIKTLVGEVSPLSGELFIHPKIKIGYFAQHQMDDLDNTLSPLQTILKLTPHAKELDVRKFLGGFNFHGDEVGACIKDMSGGEKARLALAKLVWMKPNLLLLDEPTNHLDIEMKTAIELALQSFDGAVVLISHDRHLIKTTVEQFYLIHEKKLSEFIGDIDDYKNWLNNLPRSSVVEKSTNQNAVDHKELKTIKNRIKKLEQLMDEVQLKIKNINHQLCSEELYDSSRKADLFILQEQLQEMKKKAADIEDEWVELMEKIDG